MKFCKKTLSFILAFVLLFSSITPVSAKNDAASKKTTIKGQEVIIGDTVYYVFSTDKNAKSDLIEAHEKGELQLEKLQGADGLEISGGLNGASVGAGQTEEAISYTLNIKGTNFIGVGGKTFDWNTLPDGLEVQVLYIDEDGYDHNIGSPITINGSNYNDMTTRTFEIVGDPIAFGLKTNVDSETYLTDVLLTNENAPDPSETNVSMTFDLVQVPSTNLSVKWVDVNQQPLARENTPSTILKNILTFNFIENRTFDLPNQDKEDPYFRLINKIKRVEVKDMEGATALVDSKKDGEEVTLDGKIYKLTTSYSPAFNQGSKIQLMYMPDVIDRTKNPESPTPDKYVRVTIDAGEGTKLAQGQTKKVYDVRIGKVLKAEHYPKLELLEGHKDPITWTIAPETAITKAENIKGNAAKTAAETITAANLKAVDTTALQGQELTEAFWHKGVALADNTPADKKDAFAALLKEATVTDITNPARTTAEAGDKVGTLLVTFKDGSKLEVPQQKLIVKPNTVTVAFDKAAGKEHPLRDGDTTVKGKISASSNSDKFPVSVDGAVVTIKKGDTVLSRTLAKADGSFVAGVKDPLIAGEDISVVVTLPESKTESAPVTEKVQLNPDKLNEIIKTGKEVFKHFDGKKGVNQELVKKLKEALDAADKLVDKKGKVLDSVPVTDKGQASLNTAYENIKKAIEALTGNTAPEITGTSHKEIFKGDALNLEEGITVTDEDGDADIELQGGKKFSYTVEKIGDKGAKTPVTNTTTIKDTAGTYEVTYTAKDKSGAEAKFVMTLVVKEPVIKIEDKFPEVIPEGYVKVEFKEGDHGKLEGTTKFLVKDGSAKTVLNAPTIKPNANYEATKDANWKPVLPETFTGTEENKKSFTFTAQYTYTGSDVVPQKPGDEKPDVPKDFVKVEFKKGDHGVISSEYTTIYWVNPDAGKTLKDITKPKEATAFEGYKFTGWDKADTEAIGKAGLTVTAQYKAKVVTKDPNDPEHYAKVEFLAGDQGKFEQVGGKDQVTTIWVLKKEEVKFNAPTVTPNNGFVFSGWEPELLTKYTEDKTHTAKYEPKSDISDVPVAGFQEVKFLAGTDGNFGTDNETPITTKSVWVRPGVKVDLTSKAPKVTVTNNQKGFVGWDKPLVGTFNLEKDESEQPKATEIKAVYKDKVVTTDPKDKKHYAEVEFLADDAAHTAEPRGTFEKQGEKEQTTKFWVLKNEEVTFNAPQVTAKKGYTFDKWDPEVQTSYDKDQTHTATYNTNNDVSETEVEGFIKVSFNAGDHGKFNETTPAQKTEYWVKPDTLVDLREKAPKLTADAGYIHTGWSPDLVVNFKADAGDQTITAQYGLDSDYSTTEKAGYTKITFDKGTNGEFAQGAKTELWVNPAKAITLPEPGIVPHPGYSHTGWTKNGAAVELNTPAKYDKATTITAAYESDISETEKAGFVKVSFDADKNGTIADDAKKDFWVNPNKEVNLTDRAPEVTPNSGYLFIKWDHKLVAKFRQATTIKATYASAGDIKTEETDGFAHVKFEAGQHGSFATGATVEYWVNPDKAVVLPEPRVIANKDYEHTGWNPAITPAQKYSKDSTTTITATYTKLISTEKVDGHQEIKFVAGDDGKFAGDKKEVSIWVKPNTLLDLRKSAPEVTVTTEGKTFTGWDKDLVGTFAKSDEATVFNAQYSDKISEKPVEGWTEITFKAGEHGNFGKDGTTPVVEKKLWVDPKAQVTLSEKAPTPTPNTNWLFDKWMDENAEATLSTSAMYKSAKTFTATYKSVFSDKQENDNVLITFKPGDNGRFKDGAKTTVYVTKNVEVDLREKAPVVIPDQNYGHNGWKINDTANDLSKVSFNAATDVVAYYVKGTFKADELASIDVFGPTKLSYAEDEELDLAGLKIVVKDKAGIQVTYEGAKAITDAGFTITPANKTKLKIDLHNGNPIKVSKTIGEGQNAKTIEGQTVSTLSVSKNKSAEPTDVLARNLGKNPEKTTVTGKAPKDSVIKITDINGNNLTDGTEVKVGANGEFTVTLKDKLAPGTPVKVTSTEPGKTESSPVVKQVFDDENEDGIDDKTQKTPTPTIEFAANQNTAKSDGTGASETAKQKTTVKFTVKNKPTTVYVKYTVNGEAKEETFEIGANEDATKTVDLAVKLPVGAEVKVLAKDADKLISDAASAKVVRDSNNDGKDDGKKALGEPVIEDIKAGSKSITVTPPEGATKLVISETDKDGKTPQDSTPITVTKGKDGNWKIGDTPVEKTEDGKLIIPNPEDDKKLKLDEYNVVKVDAEGDKDTTTPSKAVKTVGKAKDTEAPAKPKVDQPVDGDENIKVKTPTEPDAKTITVEVTRPAKPAGPGEEPGKPTVETIVVTKGEDGNWKTPNGEKVPEVNGKLEIPVETNKPLKTGDDVKVTTTDNDDNNSVPYTEKVVAKIKMDKPEINPIKTGDRTVEGTALTNKGKPDKFAASTVDIYKYQPPTEEGKEGTWTRIAKDVAVDQDTGAYKYNHDQGLKDGDKIRVVAKKPGAADSFNEITAGVDTTALDKAIQDGKDALDPDKGGKNNGTPEDKALEDAIKKGEDLKKKDPAPTQDEVDKAQKDIEKAIKDKKDADEARDKLQEKINEANDKKNDPEYPTKPDDVRKELDKAATDGQVTHDDKTKTKEDIDKEIEKIQEKIDQYNKQQLAVSITPPVAGTLKMELTTIPGNSKFKVYKGIVSEKNLIGEGTTNSKGIGTITFDENTVKLKSGMILRVVVEHDGYLSRTERVKVI